VILRWGLGRFFFIGRSPDWIAQVAENPDFAVPGLFSIIAAAIAAHDLGVGREMSSIDNNYDVAAHEQILSILTGGPTHASPHWSAHGDARR